MSVGCESRSGARSRVPIENLGRESRPGAPVGSPGWECRSGVPERIIERPEEGALGRHSTRPADQDHAAGTVADVTGRENRGRQGADPVWIGLDWVVLGWMEGIGGGRSEPEAHAQARKKSLLAG